MVSLSSTPTPRWYFPDPPKPGEIGEVRTVERVLVWVDPPDGDREPIRATLRAWMRIDGAWWAQLHVLRDGGRIGLTPGDWVRPWQDGDPSPLDELPGRG